MSDNGYITTKDLSKGGGLTGVASREKEETLAAQEQEIREQVQDELVHELEKRKKEEARKKEIGSNKE
jgi:hypothetical protein|tara:strand:+ start:61 stop:264 length:204 start_codon:yes stop_codon:yes gene_type:complete